MKQLLRCLILVLLIGLFAACQKKTVELAKTKAPSDGPAYTMEPEINTAGPDVAEKSK